jgi:hypothetical protein
MTPETFINAKEAIKILNISYEHFLTLVDIGKIRGYKYGRKRGERGGHYRFLLSEVVEDFKKEFSSGVR